MRISESELKAKVYAMTEQVLMEFDRDDYDEDYGESVETPDVGEQFADSGSQAELEERYPDMSMEFEFGDNGWVKVIDTETGEFYTGKGELEYESSGMGYGSSYDPYSEVEGSYVYYDFLNCLQTIMKKIDEHKPDGMEEGY